MVSFSSYSLQPTVYTSGTLPASRHGIDLPKLHDDNGRWPLAVLLEILDRESPDENTGSNSRNLFLEFLEVIGDSTLALRMLDEASDYGWGVALEDLGGGDLYVDVPGKTILLDNYGLKHPALGRSAYFVNNMLLSFTRALREIWQDRRYGAFGEYTAESVLLLERVRAADNQVVTIMACWELKNTGYDVLWRHMLGLPEGHLCETYANMLLKDPLAIRNGNAAAMAFHDWFNEPGRIAACDHGVLEALDAMLDEHPGASFGTKKAGRTCIEKISCLPDKTAYLQGIGNNILGDPKFFGMSDPINQAHFMQLVRDAALTYVENVAFRDAGLARRIFPED
ncbi:MAG: DUF6782 family putative metallopeptidase [Alphaproteobacteria bacterium]